MRELTSVDLHHLTREFQILISGKIDKIYQLSPQEYLFVFHIPRTGKKILRLVLPSLLYLTDYKPKTPKTPTGFCMFLRKYLGNARLREIIQLEPERIIQLTFETKETKYHLVIELFSPGNVILLNQEHIIMSAAMSKKWKDRDVLPKKPYTYPKSDHNLFSLDSKALFEAIRASQMDMIAKTLAVELSLGGRFAEECCLRAGIEKTTVPKEISDATPLFHAINAVLEKGQPGIVRKNEEIVDIVPIEMQTYNGYDFQKMPDFNKALDVLLTAHVKDRLREKSEQSAKKKKTKYEKIIEKQTAQLKKLENSAQKNQRIGELLYEHYNQVERILRAVSHNKSHPAVLKKKGTQIEIELP